MLMTSSVRVTATDLRRLLAEKHAGDVYVDECKNGPTQMVHGLRILDAWVMPRSWSKPWTTGYEIKAARQDFLNDTKWPHYLGLCHSLYFVTPKGLVDKSEIPQEVGLIEATVNGKRLMTRKKAPLRTDVEVPESLWRYVLMCRSTITRDRNSLDREQVWRSWLEDKKRKRDLGYEVRGRIREIVDEVMSENHRLKDNLSGLEQFANGLREAGIEPNQLHGHNASHTLRKIIGVDAMSDARRSALDCISSLNRFVDKLGDPEE